MHPKLITIGDFFLPSYGVLVALGFLLGLWVVLRIARYKKLPADTIGNLAIYCALAGLAGAKLLMLIMNFDEYRSNPSKIISSDTLLSAGVYYGGFLGAAAFALIYMRRHHLPILSTMDVLVPGVALGHAIGRMGCFAAGCCWGLACDRPWAVTFTNPDAHALVGVPLGIPLHPTQIYEAFLTLLVFVFLYCRAYRVTVPGTQLAWYLVLYSIARFFVELFRFHEQAPPGGGPFSLTQWISVALLVTGAFLLMRAKSTPRIESGAD